MTSLRDERQRLWSVHQDRWVSFDEPGDFRKSVILLPQHVVLRRRAERARERRHRLLKMAGAFLAVAAGVALRLLIG